MTSLKRGGQEARRQAIIDVAREIFVTEGLADTSMSLIAARLGGSKGTLYNYFPSKEALFAAVIISDCEIKQARLFDSIQAPAIEARAGLAELGRRYSHLALSDDVIRISRVVIAESVKFPHLGQVLNESGPQRGRTRIAAYVEGWMHVGQLRQANAMLFVEQFCEMCLGTFYRQRLMNLVCLPSDILLAEKVEQAVGVMMLAYAPRTEACSPMTFSSP